MTADSPAHAATPIARLSWIHVAAFALVALALIAVSLWLAFRHPLMLQGG